jgi:hypothetical protein
MSAANVEHDSPPSCPICARAIRFKFVARYDAEHVHCYAVLLTEDLTEQLARLQATVARARDLRATTAASREAARRTVNRCRDTRCAVR